MSPALLTQVAALVRALESTQARHLECLARKRTALRTANTEQILQIASEEESLVQQTQALVSVRQRLLRGAGAKTGATLLDLLNASSSPEAAALATRVLKIRADAARIQRENRLLWFLAQSGHLALQTMVELLEHKGKAPPLYGRKRRAAGGILIDKTV